MILVTITYREGDKRNVPLFARIDALKKKNSFQLVKIADRTDIDPNRLPLVEIGPYKLRSDASDMELLVALRAAQDRNKQIMQVEEAHPIKKKVRKEKFTFGDKLSLWFTAHYMAVINTIVGVFVGMSFLAPIFMKINWQKPAQIIYKIYSPLCHQLAFRSYFLFGEQPVYPRELAHLNYAITYETLSGSNEIDGWQAREFIGDEIVGYKVAICERDIAMYGSFFLFGIIFSLIKKKIKPLKWWLWILIGIIPIGLDGISQISGYGLQISWLPARESTPLLRTITGILFGVFTAWYLFPLVEDSMRTTKRMLVRKDEILRQSK